MSWHLAQINIGYAVARMDDPLMADFMNNLERINALAESCEGFVWRLQSMSGNATDITLSDDPKLIINMSVWESVEALFDYVYRSDHTGFISRRKEWFEKHSLAHQALWWIPQGHRPSPEEGFAKLAILDRLGPSAAAFTFKQRFPMPGDWNRAATTEMPDAI